MFESSNKQASASTRSTAIMGMVSVVTVTVVIKTTGVT